MDIIARLAAGGRDTDKAIERLRSEIHSGLLTPLVKFVTRSHSIPSIRLATQRHQVAAEFTGRCRIQSLPYNTHSAPLTTFH